MHRGEHQSMKYRNVFQVTHLLVSSTSIQISCHILDKSLQSLTQSCYSSWFPGNRSPAFTLTPFLHVSIFRFSKNTHHLCQKNPNKYIFLTNIILRYNSTHWIFSNTSTGDYCTLHELKNDQSKSEASENTCKWKLPNNFSLDEQASS